MAYDGITTLAIARELNEKICLGKIEKVYQPENNELLFIIHTKQGKFKVFATVNNPAPRVHLTNLSYQNPSEPSSLCMLFRKQLQNGRIQRIEQKDSERIIEMYIETFNELGFGVSKKLIFEIMGKHSNIILVDTSTGKIIDAVKRISFSESRIRQVFPGKIYEYPPLQDKVGFKEIDRESISMLLDSNSIAGISKNISKYLSVSNDPYKYLTFMVDVANSGKGSSTIYYDEDNNPIDFFVTPIDRFFENSTGASFDSISECLEVFYESKALANRSSQKKSSLLKLTNNILNKLELKKSKLNDDILKAEDSSHLQLYGELLTANLHNFKEKASQVELVNYYNGETLTIPLNARLSPTQNAQKYFKELSKSKRALIEKEIQIEEVNREIEYIKSVIVTAEFANTPKEIDDIKNELVEERFIKKSSETGKGKKKKDDYSLRILKTSNGMRVIVGKNNKENDHITFKVAKDSDYWFHTKDIPGSHVILLTDNKAPSDEDIIQTAQIAAYYSKGQSSDNVPVDYVQVRHVKKPSGAKPGMVIFKNNKTIFVSPRLETN